jgi:hypothetical protein
MQQPLQNSVHANPAQNGEELSFVKLHATLCFLMTKFQHHQCPQLAQFIVKHIALMIEHPEVAHLAECRTLYLQLMEQWQHITSTLLEQRTPIYQQSKIIH